MDFHFYDHSQILMNEKSKGSWFLTGIMDNDEYLNWTNSIKFNNADSEDKNSRKRKSPNNISTDQPKAAKANNSAFSKYAKDPLEIEGERKESPKKPTGDQNGTSRMPQWQVDDIADLNADIEGSLNEFGGDLSNNSYNMSDAILNISSLTVFKQEAPSPTQDNANMQLARQHQQQNAQAPNDMTNQNNIHHNSNMNPNQMINNTLHQLLGQGGFSAMQNSIDGNLLPAQNLPSDSYNLGSNSSSSTYPEDSRFQYVLAAATSIATKINEDTLTYLNQGQSYEIKLKKLGDLSTYRGKMFKSIIRICFHERRLQFMEREQISSWQKSRPGDRILEVDVPLSYGLFDVGQPGAALNTVHFTWDPTKEVGVYIKVNCISTEFTPKKHGGEKGVPFRIQVETYQVCDAFDAPKRLHAAACQIKVFKLKGADRKHKQDREKILKRPPSEQEKYQPSYECTVLNDIPNDAVVSCSPVGGPYSPKSSSPQLQPQISPPPEETLNTPIATPQVVLPVQELRTENQNGFSPEHLLPTSTPQDIANWLTVNRFDRYLQTFNNFSGADMLRMSREDLAQICGQADGIRLYNALHSKTIIPKLTIYVSREDAPIYNAIFLSTFNNAELLQKLASLIGIPSAQIRDIYMEGPQSIHVQLNNEMIRHIKEETMYKVKILQDNGTYVLILKQTVK